MRSAAGTCPAPHRSDHRVLIDPIGTYPTVSHFSQPEEA
ncbi:MAG: hypothetical protein K0S58_1060 [Nitrospira sp.]|nr:hypothetical protein [Nitrospira sp.]